MSTAIDIVLLPPPEIWESARLLNEQVNQGVKSPEIVFNPTHFPHITLVQGCIDNKDIQTIEVKIENIIKDFSPFILVAEHIKKDENGFASLEIKHNKQLTHLHKLLLELIRQYNTPVEGTSLFLPEGEAANKFTIEWISWWIESRRINFVPHITLGKLHGDMPSWSPKTFTADVVALCQLGNYCTCRKLLNSWQLS